MRGYDPIRMRISMQVCGVQWTQVAVAAKVAAAAGTRPLFDHHQKHYTQHYLTHLRD